jgi:hypothetical protein
MFLSIRGLGFGKIVIALQHIGNPQSTYPFSSIHTYQIFTIIQKGFMGIEDSERPTIGRL